MYFLKRRGRGNFQNNYPQRLVFSQSAVCDTGVSSTLTTAISNLGSYSKNSIITNFETGHPRGESTFMYVPTLWDSNALFAGIWLNNSRRVTPSDEQTAINLWLAATTIAFKSGFTGINQIILKHSVAVFKQLYSRASNGEKILREKLYIDALISLVIIDSLTRGEKDKWAADGKMWNWCKNLLRTVQLCFETGYLRYLWILIGLILVSLVMVCVFCLQSRQKLLMLKNQKDRPIQNIGHRSLPSTIHKRSLVMEDQVIMKNLKIRQLLGICENKIYKHGADICVENCVDVLFYGENFEQMLSPGVFCRAVDSMQQYCIKFNEVKCLFPDPSQYTNLSYGLEQVVYVKRVLADYILIFLFVISLISFCFFINWLIGIFTCLNFFASCFLCCFGKKNKVLTSLALLLILSPLCFARRVVPLDEAYQELEEQESVERDMFDFKDDGEGSLNVMFKSVSRNLKSAAQTTIFGKKVKAGFVVDGRRCSNVTLILPQGAVSVKLNSTPYIYYDLDDFEGYFEHKEMNFKSYFNPPSVRPDLSNCKLMDLRDKFELTLYSFDNNKLDCSSFKYHKGFNYFLWYEKECNSFIKGNIGENKIIRIVTYGDHTFHWQHRHDQNHSHFLTFLLPQSSYIPFVLDDAALPVIVDDSVQNFVGYFGESLFRGSFWHKKHLFVNDSDICYNQIGSKDYNIHEGFSEQVCIKDGKAEINVTVSKQCVFLGNFRTLKHLCCINLLFCFFILSPVIVFFIIWQCYYVILQFFVNCRN